ncbi:MAG: tetratricopeptide repeat protein, partial [Pseudomonadota bacterium]
AFKFAGFLDFNFSATASPTTQTQSGAVQRGASASPSPNPTKLIRKAGPGSYSVRTAAGFLSDSNGVIRVARPDVGKALIRVNDLLRQYKLDAAADVLAPFDPSNPAIAYAQAILAHHRRRPDDLIEAMKRLRVATANGLRQAFTLNGRLLLLMINLHDTGRITAADLKSLDGAGRAVAATKRELAKEAVQWWERGAAMGDPASLRYLGMAHALGFGTRRNLTSAIAHWRDAAGRGDHPSQAELGKIYLFGMGVMADADKAIDYLRDAVDGRFTVANLPLGYALLKRASGGDEKAEPEARAALFAAFRSAPTRHEARQALHLLGVLHQDAVQISARRPKVAAALFHAAFWMGNLRSGYLLSRAYKAGVGVDIDLERAVVYKTLADVTRSNRKQRDVTAKLARDSQLRRDLRKFAGIPRWAKVELNKLSLVPALRRWDPKRRKRSAKRP